MGSGTWEKLFEVEPKDIDKHSLTIFNCSGCTDVKYCSKCGELYDSEQIDQELKEKCTDNCCMNCIRLKKD